MSALHRHEPVLAAALDDMFTTRPGVLIVDTDTDAGVERQTIEDLWVLSVAALTPADGQKRGPAPLTGQQP